MESFLSDQSSMTSHAVVNYSSSSYGGFLFRSPNSPPPSPSSSPSPSIASLSQLFLSARSDHGAYAPAYYSSPVWCFQLRQPPLLPLPRSATLPAPNMRIPAASVRSKRQNAKRRGTVFAGVRKEESMKETSPSPMKVKEEGRSADVKVTEEEKTIESVYSLSPPPSSLPFPRFSLTRPKADGVGGGAVSIFCMAEAVVIAGGMDAGDTDDLQRLLRI